MRLVALLLIVFNYISMSGQTQLGTNINGEAGLDSFGWSTSISSDGNRFAVGAHQNDGNGNNSGHVRIFEWDAIDWVQLGNDIDGETADNSSGFSIALSSSGNRIIIGAPSNDDNGNNSGHVRIYDWNGASWIQLGNDIDGEFEGDKSGSSVSISSDGNRIAIGSPYRGDYGGVRVFEWDGISWAIIGYPINGEDPYDRSGSSVSLSADGNRIAIGAPFNDDNGNNSGHVRIYDWSGMDWIQVGTDIDGETTWDTSGGSVSLSSDGNKVAIGAGSNDGNGSNSGHTRIFKLLGGNWVQIGNDIDGEAEGDRSGGSVSLSSDGNRVAIGAQKNDGNGSNSGHTRIYDWTGTNWTQFGNDIDGQAVDDNSASSISLSSNGLRVGIGAFGAYGNGNSGNARVFEQDSFSTVNGAALHFDGSFNFVNIPNSTSTTLTSTMTMEVWVNYPENGILGGVSVIFEKEGEYGIGILDDGSFLYSIANINITPWDWINTNWQIPENEWVHLAVTYDGTIYKAFANGNLVYSSSNTGSIYDWVINENDLKIGYLPWGSNEYYEGKIDELRIWNQALDISEIQNNMNCELTGSEQDLVAYYQFNEGVSGSDNSGITSLPDITSNNNDGILNNFDLDGASSNWIAPGSVVSGSICEACIPGSMLINTWIGSSTGNWFDSESNWSLGHFPTECEGVEILGGNTIYFNNGDITKIKSLTVLIGGVLNISTGACFSVTNE